MPVQILVVNQGFTPYRKFMPDEEIESMTPAQRDAICKAYTSLTEHFPRVLLVVDFDLDDGNGNERDAHEGYWHGGALSAIGMCEFAKDRILHSGKRWMDPNEEA